MNTSKENINLGLSKEEFELLVNNSNNPELLKKYNEKLDNCDLSKSAIELINKDDLAAINRISNGITSKYQAAPKSNKQKVVLSIIVLLGIIGSLFLFNIEPTNNKKQSKEITSKLPAEDKIIIPVINEAPEVATNQNEKKNNEEKQTVSNIEETVPRTEPLDTTSKIKSIPDNKIPEQKVEEGIKAVDSREKEKVTTEFVKAKPKREVKAIQSISQVPNKYKNENYSFSDLVDYNGGNKTLEKELWNKLKGKIKDTDIPETNSSIVFKFTVSSKGKVKDISIQSLVTVELEELIKETTLNLDSWNKGKKRIPVDFTVYITFK